jgi:hypothetical protein
MNKHQYYAGDGQAKLVHDHDKKKKAGLEVTDEEFQAKLCDDKLLRQAIEGSLNVRPF